MTLTDEPSAPAKPVAGWRLWLSPKLLGLHAFAIAALVLCVFLGLWQLGAYDAQQADQAAEAAAIPAVPIEEVWGPNEPFTRDNPLRRVEVTGTFMAANEQFWVSGKTYEGVDGYWLVAPLTVQGSALLVVRGWAEQTSDLPNVPTGEVTFEAAIHPTDEPGGTFDPDRRMIDTIRIPTLINEFDYDLWSGYAIAASDTGADLVPAELPERQVAWTAGGRNLGYSLQWWAFAAFAIFMWWRMGREIVDGERKAQAEIVSLET